MTEHCDVVYWRYKVDLMVGKGGLRVKGEGGERKVAGLNPSH